MNEERRGLKAAIYGRNSQPPKGWKPTFPGEKPPGSWSLQLEQGEAAAASAGDVVAMRESDVVTGKNLNRPAWRRLLNEVKAHRVQRVYVSKLDRVVRNVAHFLEVAAVFEKADAELIFMDQPAASIRRGDLYAKAMRNMLAVFAELEWDLTRERSLAVLEVREDGRTYGPRSELPAGRPNEYGAGHKMRTRNGREVHDRPRCPLCRVAKREVENVEAKPAENGGLAKLTGFATGERTNQAQNSEAN